MARSLGGNRVLTSLATLAALALAVGFAASTFSAFSSTTANTSNGGATGTVVVGDNDSGTAMLTMTGLKPGDTDTSCIKVTSTGTLPSLVRLYGTTGGTGLDAYLNLVVTRGAGAGTFDDCSGFSADAANYIGQGAGVIYSGTLQAFADDYASGVADPRTATVPEAWTPGETHSYRFALTQADNDLAQGLTYAQSFTWEARNTTLYSQVVLSDQPSSYWKLDEAAGTSVTDSAGAVTGTYYAGPLLNQVTDVKDAGTAVTLDGVDDSLGWGDYYDFTGTAPFTIELWAKRTVYAGNQGLISHWQSGSGNGWYLGTFGSGGSFYVDRYNSSSVGVELTTTTPLQVGRWYHLVATYDGTTLRAYVNGGLEGSVASGQSLSNTPVAIATNPNFKGSMDEIAVYSSALSAQQVTEHYNAGRR
jgi:hypothetical protein